MRAGIDERLGDQMVIDVQGLAKAGYLLGHLMRWQRGDHRDGPAQYGQTFFRVRRPQV